MLRQQISPARPPRPPGPVLRARLAGGGPPDPAEVPVESPAQIVGGKPATCRAHPCAGQHN
eukprot:scaffold62495_cov17-Tisochrysis_lutea.AAC.1